MNLLIINKLDNLLTDFGICLPWGMSMYDCSEISFCIDTYETKTNVCTIARSNFGRLQNFSLRASVAAFNTKYIVYTTELSLSTGACYLNGKCAFGCLSLSLNE